MADRLVPEPRSSDVGSDTRAALPPPEAGDLVVESTAWHMAGRGDPQAPALRVLNRMGTLRLAAGRLTFTTNNGTVRFDAPVGELHSPAPAEVGAALEVWHGDTRHRFLFAGSSELAVPTAPAFGGVVGVIDSVQGISAAMAHHRGAKATVSGWLELLTPRVATSPPEGVPVRPPRTGVAYGALVALKLLVLVVVVGLVTIVPIVVLAG